MKYWDVSGRTCSTKIRSDTGTFDGFPQQRQEFSLAFVIFLADINHFAPILSLKQISAL